LDTGAARHGVGFEFREVVIGLEALARDGTTFPDAAFEALRACDGIILGPVSHNIYPPREQGGLNPSGELRKRLDLFANIRPARTVAGIPPRTGEPLDMVIMRENTEGFYSDRNLFAGPGEIMPTEDIAMSFRKITRHASTRIAEVSFAEAARRKAVGAGPGKVTAVHKANVLRLSDGLFLECCRAVASAYPDIEYEEILVDAMCAHLVRRPSEFDVICTTNMYGDILSDLATELAGSIGLAASLNAGTDHAMAQAQHGSAPDIAGKDLANPASLIGSTAMLLEWMGDKNSLPALGTLGRALTVALEAVLSVPEMRTRDLGGALGTKAFGAAVAERIEVPHG
jgi:3-isopropylmalate dehydrogenase